MSAAKLIVSDSCINCDRCVAQCPAMVGPKGPAIVRGERRSEPIKINMDACIECGQCIVACPWDFISKAEVVVPVPEPIKAELILPELIEVEVAGSELFEGLAEMPPIEEDPQPQQVTRKKPRKRR